MDTPAWMQKLFDLYGGKEAYFAASQAALQEFDDRWNQDTHLIGRVLRAHLVVEFYLTRYLQFENPNLAPLDDARITYAQKVDLIRSSHPMINELIPGLRRLGAIRNRLSHNLNADLTDDDRNVFLSAPLYRAFREAAAARYGENQPDDPVSVMEAFAMHAGSLFRNQSDPNSDKWAEALKLLTPDDMKR
jgi:hypothetical protein